MSNKKFESGGSFGGLFRFVSMLSTEFTVKRYDVFSYSIFLHKPKFFIGGSCCNSFHDKLMYILVDNDILDSSDFIRNVKHPHLLSTRTQFVNIIKFFKQVIDEALL